MNYKIIVALTSMLPMLAFAHDSIYLIEKGLKIIPFKQALSDNLKESISQLAKQEKEKGYQENNFNNAYFLLNFKKTAKQEIIHNVSSEYGEYDTHLKSHYRLIKLAFKFNGLKAINEANILGYAAVGKYIKDGQYDGWDGIRVFFDEPSIGTCSYAYNEFYGTQLYEEFIEYSVNKKPTQKAIEGNPGTGFLYVVEWFNQDNMSTLECAHKNLDKTILDKMIVLANKIDKN